MNGRGNYVRVLQTDVLERFGREIVSTIPPLLSLLMRVLPLQAFT